ncbi:GNAT family N-acetyltransferase [Demequina globuliformis]|uniref:GNAT family N-acetyltransferase n=1 Tax=Demequina globuliformis TaxID=676202 RepID=UPI0007830E4F|nr:GNAT family N-acetyltransferase [Demequina globuliformis]
MLYRVPHRIETDRLVIRRYTEPDADQLATVIARNIDHLARYMEWITVEPQSLQQRRAFIADANHKADAGEDYTFGMFLHTGELVGGSGYHVRAEPDRLAIGYWIAAEHERQGLVTEACAALTWVGLGLAGASVIDISHAPSNARSQAVPQRLGFTLQDARGDACYDRGCRESATMWWAAPADLTREPLASVERPRAFDADGRELPWPHPPR